MWIFISTPRSIQFSVNRRLIIAFTTGHMDYYMVMSSLDAKRFSKVHMVQFDFCQLSVKPQMVTICLGKWLKNRQFMSWIHFSFRSIWRCLFSWELGEVGVKVAFFSCISSSRGFSTSDVVDQCQTSWEVASCIQWFSQYLGQRHLVLSKVQDWQINTIRTTIFEPIKKTPRQISDHLWS